MNNMLLVELVKKRLAEYESFLSLIPEYHEIYGLSLENMDDDDLKVLALGLHIDVNNVDFDSAQMPQIETSKRNMSITKTEDLEDIITKCRHQYFPYGVGINRVKDWLNKYKISPKPEHELFVRIRLFIDLYLIIALYFQVECDEKFAFFLNQLEESAQNYMTVIDRSNYEEKISDAVSEAISDHDYYILDTQIYSIYKVESDTILKSISEIWERLRLINTNGTKDKQLLVIVVIDIFGYLLDRNLTSTGELYYEELFMHLADPFSNDYEDDEFFDWIKHESTIAIEEYGESMAMNILS